jgi:hypothetical protein
MQKSTELHGTCNFSILNRNQSNAKKKKKNKKTKQKCFIFYFFFVISKMKLAKQLRRNFK